MIAIEVFPGLWYEVDECKVELPQDGQRLVSYIEASFKNCLADWVVTNFKRAEDHIFEAWGVMILDLLNYGEIMHSWEVTFTPLSTKRRVAAVTKDKHGKEIHFGNWYTTREADENN